MAMFHNRAADLSQTILSTQPVMVKLSQSKLGDSTPVLRRPAPSQCTTLDLKGVGCLSGTSQGRCCSIWDGLQWSEAARWHTQKTRSGAEEQEPLMGRCPLSLGGKKSGEPACCTS